MKAGKKKNSDGQTIIDSSFLALGGTGFEPVTSCVSSKRGLFISLYWKSTNKPMYLPQRYLSVTLYDIMRQ
jgi:hypothetical protein